MENKNKILICIGVILVIIIGVMAVFLVNNINNQPVIYNNTIKGVGTFNTTNVTNFKLDNNSDEDQLNYLANDSITQVTTTNSTWAVELSKSTADKVNDSAGGHTIYKNTANMGSHKGEIRYLTFLEDNDNKRWIMISTPSHELTSMMVDSFVFLEPTS